MVEWCVGGSGGGGGYGEVIVYVCFFSVVGCSVSNRFVVLVVMWLLLIISGVVCRL